LYFHGQLPTWNDFLEHPNYDAYWLDQNVLKDLKGITPAVLNVTASPPKTECLAPQCRPSLKARGAC
jgi:hypothetical protein